MALGDPCTLYTTTLTPNVSQLEAEWTANWRPSVLHDNSPYLFSELNFAAFANPTVVKLYVRDRLGKWSLVADGSITITAMDPSDGYYQARHFIGGGCSGFVWASDHAGTVVTTRGGVGLGG